MNQRERGGRSPKGKRGQSWERAGIAYLKIKKAGGYSEKGKGPQFTSGDLGELREGYRSSANDKTWDITKSRGLLVQAPTSRRGRNYRSGSMIEYRFSGGRGTALSSDEDSTEEKKTQMEKCVRGKMGSSIETIMA